MRQMLSCATLGKCGTTVKNQIFDKLEISSHSQVVIGKGNLR